MKVKLTRSQYKQMKMFKYRKLKLLTYYEIIDDPQNKDMEMYQYVRLPVRIIAIILSPLAIFVGGVPASISLIKECLTKKQVGADTFSKELFYKELEQVK